MASELDILEAIFHNVQGTVYLQILMGQGSEESDSIRIAFAIQQPKGNPECPRP
jgi:hypothetical protein